MSLVFVGDSKVKEQIGPGRATVQKLLDENSQLIKTIVEYQNQGRVQEAVTLQETLHRNLIYLAQLSDASGPLLKELKEAEDRSAPSRSTTEQLPLQSSENVSRGEGDAPSALPPQSAPLQQPTPQQNGAPEQHHAPSAASTSASSQPHQELPTSQTQAPYSQGPTPGVMTSSVLQQQLQTPVTQQMGFTPTPYSTDNPVYSQYPQQMYHQPQPQYYTQQQRYSIQGQPPYNPPQGYAQGYPAQPQPQPYPSAPGYTAPYQHPPSHNAYAPPQPPPTSAPTSSA